MTTLRSAGLFFAAVLCTSQCLHVIAADQPNKYSEAQLTFASKPLEKSPKLDANNTERFPVRNIDDLNGLDDTQLAQVFLKGVPDIPSALESEKGMYTMCVGRPLSNGFTANGSWPRGTWPQGGGNPINNVIERFWRGKVFLTDPVTNKTTLWNLFFSNSTVGAVGNVSVQDPGITDDKKPSVVLDYSHNENVILRPLKDELRRVGGNVWLGRGWVASSVESLYPTDAIPLAQPYLDATKPVVNNTWLAAVQSSGLEGPASTPTISGAHYQTGSPFALFYFALDCVDQHVPKLYYIPTSVQQNVLNSAVGYAPLLNTLPELNKDGDANAVENLNLEFPVGTEGPTRGQPFILYPWRPSDAGPTGFLRIPAQPFEPIFGAWWLYNQTNPGNPTTTGLAAQIAEIPPRIPALDPRNPVTYP
eukprot:jgi/Botrbrau1/13072/Bobra.0187s0034.1